MGFSRANIWMAVAALLMIGFAVGMLVDRWTEGSEKKADSYLYAIGCNLGDSQAVERCLRFHIYQQRAEFNRLWPGYFRDKSLRVSEKYPCMISPEDERLVMADSDSLISFVQNRLQRACGLMETLGLEQAWSPSPF